MDVGTKRKERIISQAALSAEKKMMIMMLL